MGRGGGGANNCIFVRRIRTLVALLTYSSHRLIMGKVEIDNFWLLEIVEEKKSQVCLLSSPPCFV